MSDACLAGLLVGGAVGDSLGLPAEGLSPSRQRRWWPGDLRHRFIFGWGMISDDTEHALMTAQALLVADGDLPRFRKELAWSLRWWFASLPAGVGLATARACARLWCGVSSERSGVNSAGNGPAMRSAIIGAVLAGDESRRREFVRASTRLTHTDARAETAAQAVAECTAWIVTNCHSPTSSIIGLEAENGDLFGNSPVAGGLSALWSNLLSLSEDGEWRSILLRMQEALATAASPRQFARVLGLSNGVSGYAYHTVPVALFGWLRHRKDVHRAVASVVRCGGDTDTVAAITGALAGCEAGERGIPPRWRSGLRDWPQSAGLIRQIAQRLASADHLPVRWFWPGRIPRNFVFLFIVLMHGFRRLLPPY